MAYIRRLQMSTLRENLKVKQYPVIEIWRKYPGPESTGWRFECVTTWSKTCKEAKAKFLESNPDLAHAADRIKVHFKK